DLDRSRFLWMPPTAAVGFFFTVASTGTPGLLGDAFAALGLWTLALLFVAAAETSRPFLAHPQKDNALAFGAYSLALGYISLALVLVVAGFPVALSDPFSLSTAIGVWWLGALILRRRGGTYDRRWFLAAAVAACGAFLLRDWFIVPDFVAQEIPALVVLAVALAIPFARTLYPSAATPPTLPPAAPGTR
ncbi:MAG TPA: hypothetical protein VI818_01110, partial [Candidatus Thermoplasmatota archaeon]|nr:hypothetical protein [Candidatus Thermoplasmatota archaeon]